MMVSHLGSYEQDQSDTRATKRQEPVSLKNSQSRAIVLAQISLGKRNKILFCLKHFLLLQLNLNPD